MGGVTDVAPAASTEHEATDEVERLAASIYGTIVASSVLAASASNLSIGETCLAVIGLSTLTLAALGWVAAGRAGMAGLPRLGTAAASSVAGLVLIGLKLSL